jgi:hypothetical protein
MGNNVQEEYVVAIFISVRTNSATRMEASDCSGTLAPVLHCTWRHTVHTVTLKDLWKPQFSQSCDYFK